jgi:enoyl-[acyl-carrier-protein] reductase (NADH)
VWRWSSCGPSSVHALPRGQQRTDPISITRAALFLLSPGTTGSTGVIVHVDSDFHAIGA